MPVDILAQKERRQVWQLAAPLILSNMSVPLLGAVDTAVVGRLPDPAYIGGVAVGAVIFNFLYWGFGFLRMGTTGLTAQAYGAGNMDEVRATFGRAMILAFSLAGILLLLQIPIGWAGFGLLDASAEVETQARTYYAFRIWDAPAALGNYVLLGWLLGMKKTRSTLVLQVIQNGVNIGLDILFVFGFGWGIAGVALATVAAQYAGFGVGIWIVLRTLEAFGGEWKRHLLWDKGRLLHLVRVNRDIFLRTLCLIFGFSYFTQQGAKLGDVVLAANAILLHFQSVQAYGLDAFAHAAEILVGNAAGSGDRNAFKRTVIVTTQWAVGTAAVFAAAYALFGGALIRLMTVSDSVRLTADGLLPWMVASPLVSVWSFQLDGIFIGTTRTKEMRNGMALSLGVYLLAMAILVPHFGNTGLWMAFMGFMGMRAATLAAWYPRIVKAITPK